MKHFLGKTQTILKSAHARAQITKLISEGGNEKTRRIKVAGRDVPLRFRRGPDGCKRILIGFHGAMDRKTRKIPAFIPFLPGMDQHAHQLLVSDPSMLLDKDFSVSWYAGDDNFASQDVVPKLLHAICDELGVEHPIYFGASGGGFAALYMGWHHPDSTVVVMNPHTSIDRYYAAHVERYKATCWPELKDESELKSKVCTDVGELYAERFRNLVIYVQANSDHFHLLNQMTPFLQAVAHHRGKNLICNVDYWGKFGHTPTFGALQPWLQALFSAPERTVESIIKTRALLQSAPVAANAPRRGSSDRDIIDATDVAKSDVVRSWLLDH